MHAMIPVIEANVEYHSGLSKAQLGYKNKAHDWESPTWDWLLKRKIPSEHAPDSHKSSVVLCDLRVIAWDNQGEPINRGLTQMFSPDKEGEKGARMYARALIAEGYALMTEVIWSIRFTYSGDEKQVQSQTYERADL